MANPYPKTIIDEASGIEVKNIKHEVFEEGRRQGIKQVLEEIKKLQTLSNEKRIEELEQMKKLRSVSNKKIIEKLEQMNKLRSLSNEKIIEKIIEELEQMKRLLTHV